MVFADALGVPEADRAEALAIADALGARATPGPGHRAQDRHRPGLLRRARCWTPPPRCSPWSTASIPPTPNVFDVCHDLDLVTGRARPAELRTALVLSRGLMGSNSALVLRRGTDDPLVRRRRPLMTATRSD